jgi:hypothetical protein
LKNTRTSESGLTVVALFLCLLTATGTPAAALSFANSSLKGSYGVLLNTTTSATDVTNQTYLGILSFNGAGKVTAPAFTIDTGGTITTVDSFSGSYSVKSNGTGSLTMTDADKKTLDLAFVINAAGKGLVLLQTNPSGSSVMAGIATAMVLSSFTNADLKGTYAVLENSGVTTSNTSSPNPEAIVGIATFDGVSKITTSSTGSHDGTAESLGSSTGTYSVSSDGTVSVSLTNSKGKVSEYSAVLNSSGTGFQFLDLSCNCGNGTLSGTGTHQ